MVLLPCAMASSSTAEVVRASETGFAVRHAAYVSRTLP